LNPPFDHHDVERQREPQRGDEKGPEARQAVDAGDGQQRKDQALGEPVGRAVFGSVSFAHRPDDIPAVERAFGCPVHAEASWNGLSMPRSTWELPLRRGDPRLQRVLEAQAPSPADAGSVVFDVRRVVTARLREGVPDIHEIARHLGVSVRTLQRRLADAGQSFNTVVETTRPDAAKTWLSGSELAIGEIGYLLGYSDVAAFHRAFKRWTGVTPHSFRRERGDRYLRSARRSPSTVRTIRWVVRPCPSRKKTTFAPDTSNVVSFSGTRMYLPPNGGNATS
jgi:AraC-like DNA-binding protein